MPEGEYATGYWRLHDECNCIRPKKSLGLLSDDGDCGCMGERRDEQRILVAQPEGKRSRGRPAHGWGL